MPPAPKGAASRAPSSTPVGELRTGRIWGEGGAVTTFEELRTAFDQGQFRDQSAASSPFAPSGAAASAPAATPTASDAEPIVVEDRGDDIGLANSDGEPETHHPFTTQRIGHSTSGARRFG